jgi:hypothetical protein
MIPRLIVGLVVVGLAIGVWALWPQDEPEPSPTTTVDAVGTTSTVIVPLSTTTTEDSHVVTTVEEAEEILRGLWFGWFEGIYTQDEERIKEVVGSHRLLDNAKAAFESVSFVAAPTIEGVVLDEAEILLSDEICLVIWSGSDVVFLDNPQGTLREGVDVFRWTENGWLMVSSWQHKSDLWETDCESVLEPLS